MRAPSDVMRRAADVTGAVMLGALTFPVVVVAAAAVRVTMGRPVLFRQQRSGKAGVPFTLYKLRTMRDPSPSDGSDDARLTRLGRWLRSTSIDELPSLVNVVIGDLALVGPRPLPVEYWPRFRGDEYERFLVTPGLTGLAQVSGRNRVDWDERLALDVQYVRTRSLVGDLRILGRTIPLVLRRSGINDGNSTTMSELPADRLPSAP